MDGGKYDLYRMSDRRDLVEFVKEVQKYPCLYDKTKPEYTNKIHNRRAWSTIAAKANTTVPDCRDKWRKIRISFLRSLKQQQSDKPPLRPYYLTEELNFLIPFLNVKPKTTDGKEKEMQSPTKEDNMDFEESTLIKHEISDSDSDPFENESIENDTEINRITIINGNINKTPNVKRNSIENENGHHIKQNGARIHEDIESNPRKMFLLSMLPDIESFTETEMRIFKREVINIVDNIMNSRANT